MPLSLVDLNPRTSTATSLGDKPARRIYGACNPGGSGSNKAIEEHRARSIRKGPHQVLIVTGAPGIGKTEFAQALSSKLGVPMIVISMSAAQSSAALAGSESHWSNTEPGQVFRALVLGEYMNPSFLLDELEKAPTNWGDPSAALYQLLEPRTAAQFRDKSVPWLALDASRVNWIGTANDPAPLHEAIVSRFVLINAGAPQEEQLRGLIQSLYSALLTEFDLLGQFPVRLDRQSESALLGGSIRDVKRRLRSALGVALRIGARELRERFGSTEWR